MAIDKVTVGLGRTVCRITPLDVGKMGKASHTVTSPWKNSEIARCNDKKLHELRRKSEAKDRTIAKLAGDIIFYEQLKIAGSQTNN